MTLPLHIFSERVLLPDFSIHPCIIRIQDGIIQSVTPATREIWTTWKKDLSELEYEDLGDALVTPAFVNAHTHLCMLAFRGIGGLASLQGNVVKDLYFKLERNLLPEDVRAFTRLGAVEALLSGTGMVWEHYYFGNMLVEGLQDVGLCGAVASTLQDIDGPGKDRTEKAWEETLSLHQNSVAAAQGIVAAIGPHATDTVSDELWTQIARTADEHNLPIHSHLAQALDEVEWSWNHHDISPLGRMQRLGITDLEVNKLWVHALYVGDDELKMLNPKFDRLGHCPTAQMQFGFPAHTNAWRNQGFDILLGTDSPSCNDSINIQAELRLFGAADAYGVTMGDTLRKFRQDPVLKKARAVQNERQIIYDMRAPFVAPESLLSTLWNHPADLPPQAPVGMIEDGRWANLLVWDTNHPCFWPNTDPLQALTMANVTPGLKRIMTRGDWKFDGDGYLAHRVAIDPMVNLWRVEASERLEHLWSRAGL